MVSEVSNPQPNSSASAIVVIDDPPPSSTYYLHASDNSSLILVTEPLTGDNFGESDPVWKFIQTVGEKLGFGTCPNLNWVIEPGLEIHLNGRGKIGCLIVSSYLYKFYNWLSFFFFFFSE